MFLLHVQSITQLQYRVVEEELPTEQRGLTK